MGAKLVALKDADVLRRTPQECVEALAKEMESGGLVVKRIIILLEDENEELDLRVAGPSMNTVAMVVGRLQIAATALIAKLFTIDD